MASFRLSLIRPLFSSLPSVIFAWRLHLWLHCPYRQVTAVRTLSLFVVISLTPKRSNRTQERHVLRTHACCSRPFYSISTSASRDPAERLVVARCSKRGHLPQCTSPVRWISAQGASECELSGWPHLLSTPSLLWFYRHAGSSRSGTSASKTSATSADAHGVDHSPPWLGVCQPR